MLTQNNYISKITQVKLTLHAELTEIVCIVMLVVDMRRNQDIQDFMLCVHQEATTFKEIGILSGWASTSGALTKIVQ